MRFTKKFAACLTIIVFTLAMTTIAFAAESGVDWERGVVRATGIGVGKSTAKTEGVKRAQAKRAATMDAQRNLAETVKGVHITAESTMKDLELADDIVRTQVDTIISNMSEVDVQYFEDGTCQVILEMPLFGSGKSLSTAAFLPFKDEPKTDFPKPVDVTIVNEPTVINGNYTGLVIDCRGKSLDCVMSPLIKKEDGTTIYGHMNFDYDKIVINGMVGYAGDAHDQTSVSRAGNNPLVIKAVRLDDFNSTPVVSVADADKILAANSHDKFLDKCAVVFLK